MKAFIESRLDVGYDYGETGGPEFNTEVAELSSGHEHRNARWSNGRGRWELGERNIVKADKDYLLAFFRAVRGRTTGFRFKDWQDFEVIDAVLSPDGSPTVQLVRTYTEDAASETRVIEKPVAGTVSMKRGGSGYTFASVDTTTGIVTLAKDADRSIANVSAASPAVVDTSSAHGFSTGGTVWITGTGLPEIDDQTWQITNVDADTFTLDGSDTSDTGGASSGSAERYVQPGETLTASFEFDTPVRFDTQEFRARFIGTDDREYIYALASLPVVEIRG